MKPEIYGNESKIGRRKKVCFYYQATGNSSARGYNQTVLVWELTKENRLMSIGYDDHIQTAGWKGAQGVACSVIAAKYSDFQHDGYHSSDPRVAVMQEI